MGLFQTLTKSCTDFTKYEIGKRYTDHFISGETYERGYIFERNELVLTNVRLIDFIKIDSAGHYVQVEAIPLENICKVECDTAGFSRDYNKIQITYHASSFDYNKITEYKTKKLAFPRKFCITPLWVKLETAAYNNQLKLEA